MIRLRIPGLVALALSLAATARADEAAPDPPPPAEWEVAAGETVPESWVVTPSARVAGEVTEDLFLLADRAEISGMVAGDLWVAASTLDLSGVMEDDVRFLARMATVSGTVAGNLRGQGQAIQITPDARIQGRVWLDGGTVMVQGQVGGAMRIRGQDVTVGGSVGGDVRIEAPEITLMPGTKIGGDLVYVSSRSLVLDRGVEVGGELIREDPEPRRMFGAADVGTRLAFWVGALLVATAIMAIRPSVLMVPAVHLREAPLRCLLLGFPALIAFPVLAVLSALSLVGLPLALVTAGVYGFITYTGKMVMALALAMAVARRLPARRRDALLFLLPGLAAYYALGLVPALAGPLWMLAAAYGLGAHLAATFRRPAAPPPTAPADTAG